MQALGAREEGSATAAVQHGNAMRRGDYSGGARAGMSGGIGEGWPRELPNAQITRSPDRTSGEGAWASVVGFAKEVGCSSPPLAMSWGCATAPAGGSGKKGRGMKHAVG